MTSELIQARDSVLEELEHQLLGPANGEDEIIDETAIGGAPYWRYMAGMLFPSESSGLKQEVADEGDPEYRNQNDPQVDPEVSAAYDPLPSSMGLTFLLLESPEINITVHGARYLKHTVEPESESDTKQSSRNKVWRRAPLRTRDDPESLRMAAPVEGAEETSVHSALDGTSEVIAHFRPWNSGHLVTVTLVNRLEPRGEKVSSNTEQILFQCGFSVSTEQGRIAPYPRSKIRGTHAEDAELDFIYRHNCAYGIGHGCAASWDPNAGIEGVKTIKADPLPRVEVKSMTNRIRSPRSEERALDIGWLSDESRTRPELRASLSEFVDRYEQWVREQATRIEDVDEADKKVAVGIHGAQERAVQRMRSGIDCLLGEETSVLKSFQL